MPLDRKKFGFHIDGFLSPIFDEMGIEEQDNYKHPIINDKDRTLRALNATKKLLVNQQLTPKELNQLKTDDTWDGAVNELRKLITGEVKFIASGEELNIKELNEYLQDKIDEKIALVQSQKTSKPKLNKDEIYDLVIQKNQKGLDKAFDSFKKNYQLSLNHLDALNRDLSKEHFREKYSNLNEYKQLLTEDAKLREEFDKRVKEFVTTPSSNKIFDWEPKKMNENNPIDFSFNLTSTSSDILRLTKQDYLEENLGIQDQNILHKLNATIEDFQQNALNFFAPLSLAPKTDFLLETKQSLSEGIQSLKESIIRSASSNIDPSFFKSQADNIWKSIGSFGGNIMEKFKLDSKETPPTPKNEVDSNTTIPRQNLLKAMNKAVESNGKLEKNYSHKRGTLESTKINSIPSPSPSSRTQIKTEKAKEGIAYFGESEKLIDHAIKTNRKNEFRTILSENQKRIISEKNGWTR